MSGPAAEEERVRTPRGASGEVLPSAPPAQLHRARPAVPPLPEDARGFLAVLRRRDFRMLWAAQAASQLADKFLMFTLLVVVYRLTGHGTTESVLMVCYTLPSVVLSAPAGVYADRHDKRTLMLGTNVLRGGLILLIPLTLTVPYLKGQAWPLLLITLLFSAAGQVFAPAEAASIPFLVTREQIMPATSLFMTTVIITLVAGVPAATVSTKVFGDDRAPFYIAAGLFGLAAFFIWRLGTSLRAAARAHAPATDVRRELREGLALLGGDPVLRLALGELSVALIVVFTVFALGPPYMARVLDRPPEDTYLVLIPATVGLVSMAVLLGHGASRISRAHALVGSTVIGGLTLVGIGLVPDVLRATGSAGLLTPFAVVLSTAFGCALGALLIPAFTVLQERTNEESRGRIFGGIFTVINAAVAVPLLLAGGLADGFGVDRVVAGLGVILGICGLLAWRLGGDRLRILDDVRPAGVAGT